MSEQIIYEVELVDSVPRFDIEGNGDFLKYYDVKPDKNEWETPTDQDEVRFDLTIKQKAETDPDQFVELHAVKAWDTTMDDDGITITVRRCLQSFKRGEKSMVEVRKTFAPEHDKGLLEVLEKSGGA